MRYRKLTECRGCGEPLYVDNLDEALVLGTWAIGLAAVGMALRVIIRSWRS